MKKRIIEIPLVWVTQAELVKIAGVSREKVRQYNNAGLLTTRLQATASGRVKTQYNLKQACKVLIGPS